MNELALFAGAGGGLLATKWMLGWRTVCYVENAAYPVEVLKARIRDGLLDDAPIWDDARTFDGRPWRGCVDIVTAGFPCQPFSLAGQQRAERDERNMWPDTIRIVGEVRPRWCLLENVPGLLAGSHGYFGTILRELAESGYDARWRVLSAAEVGAPHRRDRLWIAAHASESGRRAGELDLREGQSDACRCGSSVAYINKQYADGGGRGAGAVRGGRSEAAKLSGGGADVANSYGARESQPGGDLSDERGRVGDCGEKMANANGNGRRQMEQQNRRGAIGERAICPIAESSSRGAWWKSEPDVGQVADGVASRVDRLRAIGNGQVPAVVGIVWELLTES